MSLPRRYKAGASPGNPIFAAVAGPSFCTVYIAPWMDFPDAACCSREEEDLAWAGQTVNLPRDLVPCHSAGCPIRLRVAVVLAKGRGQESSPLALACQQWPSGASCALACFQREWLWPSGA